jgi:DNA-directed RNA polymerase subunit alpha
MTVNEETNVLDESEVYQFDDIYNELLIPKYEVDTKSNNEMIFKMAPLERGYGQMFGYLFRRVLLSSMLGTSIVKVAIDGVSHEYTTIKGVVQDVQTLLLNLKGVVIKPNNGDVTNLCIDVKGPMVLTAGDIQIDNDAEIVNKDHVICEISGKESLKINMLAIMGRGYESASSLSENEVFGNEVNALYLDASFSPIDSVVYQVDNARVGNRTDLDKLTLIVKTNGTITPDQEVRQLMLHDGSHTSNCLIRSNRSIGLYY